MSPISRITRSSSARSDPTSFRACAGIRCTFGTKARGASGAGARRRRIRAAAAAWTRVRPSSIEPAADTWRARASRLSSSREAIRWTSAGVGTRIGFTRRGPRNGTRTRAGGGRGGGARDPLDPPPRGDPLALGGGGPGDGLPPPRAQERDQDAGRDPDPLPGPALPLHEVVEAGPEDLHVPVREQAVDPAQRGELLPLRERVHVAVRDELDVEAVLNERGRHGDPDRDHEERGQPQAGHHHRREEREDEPEERDDTDPTQPRSPPRHSIQENMDRTLFKGCRGGRSGRAAARPRSGTRNHRDTFISNPPGNAGRTGARWRPAARSSARSAGPRTPPLRRTASSRTRSSPSQW